MQTVILVFHILAAVGIVVLVLLQHGKGADMGAAFGSGASGSLFGASGSANFLSRTTAVLASVFFVTTLGIAVAAHPSRGPKAGAEGVMGSIPSGTPVAPAAAPAAPVPAPAKGKDADIPK